MPDPNEVAAAAQRLGEQKDDAALEVLVGMRATAIDQNPALAENLDLDDEYVTTTMGLDDVKRVGARVLKRWNKELNGLVCGGGEKDSEERKAVLASLNLGEAAVIAAVAGALLSLGLAGALAAPLAPLIVRRFIWPAKEELCTAWGEALEEG